MSTLRRLLSDLGSILLALALAFIVWIVATNEENPLRSGWTSSIPIKYVNWPSGLVPVGELSDRVQARIRAPSATWDNLRPADFSAVADMAGAKLGDNQIDLHVECSDSKVKILEVDRTRITVRMERLAQVVLPIRVNILDSPPFGFELKNEEITTTPLTVTVSGPEPAVNRVVQVAADVSVRDATAPIERQVNLVPRDVNDLAVEDAPTGPAAALPGARVSVEPRLATVKIPVVQKRGFRNLPVRVVWTGQPAAGYRISNVAVDPSIVTAIGDPGTIDRIPGYLETVPVKVDGATADVQARVALVLPESVAVLGGQAVQVSISVTPIESSLTIQRAVTVQGVAPFLIAAPSPLVVDVILSGPLPKLDALRPEDVQVILNLVNLDAGSYQVTPSVIAPEGITVKSVVPAKVQVELTVRPGAEPTPTPTVAAAATPTSTRTNR
jgi:YbbR domain-containing protein